MELNMEIKGKFGVEIYNKDGNLDRKIENHNTVSKLAIRQIKRWLDRNEYVNLDIDLPRGFRDSIMCAGEMRRISVFKDIRITRDDEGGDSPDYPIGNALDNSDETYFSYWNSRDGWRAWSIRFKEPVNLKGFGILKNYDSSSSWHGGKVDSFSIKFDGLKVENAGTSEYNSGEYIAGRTKYNNHRFYKKDDSEHYIFSNHDETKWQMSTSLGGDAAYETNTTVLPEHPWTSTWSIVNGDALAPTLTEGNDHFRNTYITEGNELVLTDDIVEGREFGIWWRDHQMDDYDKNSERYMGKYAYRMRTFESVEDLYNEGSHAHPKWYGYIPDIKEVGFTMYSNGNSDHQHYDYRYDFYEAVPHPQNPYALKLGTDDGTILPLSDTNTELGAFESGMEWKCHTVEQQNGFVVRYSRALQPEDANGVTFKEIGLFMNADGHLPHKMTEPRLENADDLFARAFFSEPWSKTEDQTATIYYEITVN
jgi:hypothetical protein